MSVDETLNGSQPVDINQIVENGDKKKSKRKKKSKSRENDSAIVVNEPTSVVKTTVLQNKKIKFDKLEEIEVAPQPEIASDKDSANGNNPNFIQSSTIETVEERIIERERPILRSSPQVLQKKGKELPKNPKVIEFYSDNEDEDDFDFKGLAFDKSSFSKENIRKIKQKAEELLEIRKTLPVFKAKDELIPTLLKNKVNILIGETGSGKSTQIPQFLMPLNSKGIAVTQPRRVAAINLATRVSQEHGCVLGTHVGFSVRFNNATRNDTKLKYLTDGMLLRELMIDPLLSRYSTIIIDEAHERTILTDLLMGFLKSLVTVERKDDPDFRVIIMSATLDAEKFSKFFADAPILFVEGKMYPVERSYVKAPVDDIVDTVVKTLVHLNQGEQKGDVLCFLPGQEEIDKAEAVLNQLAPLLPKEAPRIVPLPLYAALPSAKQAKVFLPVKNHQRKLILATNIAETSVTVPGIKYVVDSGLRKVKVWRHQLGLSTLLTTPISKASATQRSGRAGRESEGKCFRLYTESDYFKLIEQTEPEIVRSDIISPVLMLKRLQVDDILNWHWLENPGQEALIAALQQLYSLQAIDEAGKITDLGEKMTVLPLAPHLSSVLITGHENGCLEPVIDIVSCLSVDNLILNPASDRRDEVNERRRAVCNLGNRYGDLMMMKELFDMYLDMPDSSERKRWCKELDLSFKGFKNVLRVREQLRQYMNNLYSKEGASILAQESEEYDEELGITTSNKPMDVDSILKSFLKGFINNTAIGMPDRSYRTVTTGQLIAIHPSSMVFGKKLDAIMYIEYVYTTRGYARNVSSVQLEWLQEVAPHLLGTRTSIN
ncbi:ATP-dependent RNA helicase [Komagataella phaffii CBS 7435]|uniref:RNA helicase n=2 Tax=Komagataella phaffii TaxID=460519 RepID=C4R584_KOMPG|nr:Predominantly nucleolar DEAH-box ATP-dependent RNA helicase, required for 18S rRNA synthesis [Komagataella phaffii GS115]AOA63310.1 GQ67_03760T0 [Komagataella phaffii]CAH2449503.1 ATP-dependent RNA helicase [Komagataella phaffii CBS 7435]AOA68590.1 GQ68_03732T0 [Komagataella phaffii GS115]CAY70720.1 Predominantly nucleolar DEAH-box ATP-dependent RNA helicase, required for 18S rRNA synthesis [Komagataella phaffii GS115]CCA39486.1 ATP-dependent RNA helicase [Komagataella phaffii CBS 7435]